MIDARYCRGRSRRALAAVADSMAAAAALFALMVCVGCVVTRESDTEGDSTTSVTIALDTMPAQTAMPPATTVPEIPNVATTPSGSSHDTMATRVRLPEAVEGPPTLEELEVLSEELTMPLGGVAPSELLDTFHEPRGGGTRVHEALDIMAPRGTPVLSATPGRILRLHSSKDGGLMVYAADASERFVLMYAHLDGYAPGLRDGLPLNRGQVLGYVGTTGNAPPNAPHLHFAIAHPRDVNLWWTGTPVDPRALLQRGSRR